MGKLPARKRRILFTAVAVAVSVAAAGLLIVSLQPESRPYTAGEPVEGVTSSLDRPLPPDYPRIDFAEVSRSAGIHFVHFAGARSTQLPEDMGSGAAWGDYDGDGNPDLYVCDVAGALNVSSGAMVSSGNRLYRNNGDSTFTDVTEAAGVGFRGTSMGAAWGDYDDDGDLDLVVTTYGKNILYRNQGDGRFTDVSRTAGIAEFNGFWTGASWGDYDGDRDLDLYICGYVKYRFSGEDSNKSSSQYQAVVPFTLNPSSYEPERNLLLRNEGGRFFREVAAGAGVQNRLGRSLSAAWCDFDQDGWLDLYVANDISDNVLYRNLGNGRFEDISHEAWVADYRGAMGLAVGDWDNDTDLDIFITHWLAQENALFNNLRHFPQQPGLQDGLHFFDVADQTGLGQIALDFIGWGTSFFDYDNDGFQDLFVANGSTFQDEKDPRLLIGMRDLLFWNRGGEDGFFEVGTAAGTAFQKSLVGRGAAFADFDSDGDVDIFIVNHQGPAWLLENRGGNRNNWLQVRVTGSEKNRYGLGARVEVSSGPLHQVQVVGAQSSYLSQNELRLTFGLGDRKVVDRLLVRFPGGATRTVENPAINQVIEVDEKTR